MTHNITKNQLKIFSSFNIFEGGLKSNLDDPTSNCYIEYNKNVRILDIVMASAAIPYYFKPILIENNCEYIEDIDYFIDGFQSGVNLPLNVGIQILNTLIFGNKNNLLSATKLKIEIKDSDSNIEKLVDIGFVG